MALSENCNSQTSPFAFIRRTWIKMSVLWERLFLSWTHIAQNQKKTKKTKKGAFFGQAGHIWIYSSLSGNDWKCKNPETPSQLWGFHPSFLCFFEIETWDRDRTQNDVSWRNEQSSCRTEKFGGIAGCRGGNQILHSVNQSRSQVSCCAFWDELVLQFWMQMKKRCFYDWCIQVCVSVISIIYLLADNDSIVTVAAGKDTRRWCDHPSYIVAVCDVPDLGLCPVSLSFIINYALTINIYFSCLASWFVCEEILKT